MKTTRTKITILATILALALAACSSGVGNGGNDPDPRPHPTPNDDTGRLLTEAIDLSAMSAADAFSRFYTLDALDVELKVPGFALPLRTTEIANFDDVAAKIDLGVGQELLLHNGFAVRPNPFDEKEEDIVAMYKTLRTKEIPLFVTVDSLLHLYHIQFDETLRQIEERIFYADLFEISKVMMENHLSMMAGTTGDEATQHRMAATFFAVALSMLEPQANQVCRGEPWECDDGLFEAEEEVTFAVDIPTSLAQGVAAERELIDAHRGFVPSPLMTYKEDYSQYVPRGHYTRSEKLKNYFRAMMWMGRITFRLHPDSETATEGVTEAIAQQQTRTAVAITRALQGNLDLLHKWKRIERITGFYVGHADDLDINDYDAAITSATNSGTLDIEALRADLDVRNDSRIGSGQGECTVNPGGDANAQYEACLNRLAGLRLFGQKFVPDSYYFQNLVSHDARPEAVDAFTYVPTQVGPIRGFPRGLDVMSLLGSDVARTILSETNDDAYDGYDEAHGDLTDEIDAYSALEWNQNLYWSWLFGLKPLLKEFGAGYPTAMQTDAWARKSMTGALASWAALRHDTILYAKQSYTGGATSCGPGCEGETPPPVRGYVEPVPEAYNRLLAIARMTRLGLESMEVLDEFGTARLEKLEEILARLVSISVRELENEELTEEDYDFIKSFGTKVEGVIAGVTEKAKKTTIVADVHTDGNTAKVLEEGLGYVDMITVAYRLPDGRVLVGAGPVTSYYEFKHPMSDRLTDEAWRTMLERNAPDRPEWFSDFGVTR